MEGEIIIAISSAVSALAAVAIAIFAHKSHQLSKKITADSEDFKQNQISLMKAIVLSNIVACPGKVDSQEFQARIDRFNKLNEDGIQV